MIRNSFYTSMSINSKKEQEVIDRLQETVPACAFAFIHWDSNIGEEGELYATGQVGNPNNDGFQNHLHIAGMHLLMIENHYDHDIREIVDLSLEAAENIKDGKFPGKVSMELDMDRPPETV